MQLSVKGKQLNVGDALRTHVSASLSRILGKYIGDAIEVGVTFSRDGRLYRAVVAEMATEIPSLTVSEAVMRMDLAEQPALMFRNSSHSGRNMIYRRPDGNIGWVDPRGNRGE